jgi:hypothetical protein
MLTEGEQRPTEPKEPAGGKPEAPGETGGERLGKDIRVRGESERGDSGHIGRVEEVGGKTVPQELGGVPRPLEGRISPEEKAHFQPLVDELKKTTVATTVATRESRQTYQELSTRFTSAGLRSSRRAIRRNSNQPDP